MLKRWPSALGALLAALMLALFGSVPAASAHAYVLRTDPADGAVLAAAPKELQVWFSEPVALKLSHFELDDSHNRQFSLAPGSAASADQTPASAGESPVEAAAVVFLDVPPLAPGAYRLSWRAISAIDLHATTGDIVFGVQTAAVIPRLRATNATPSLAEVVLRWLSFGGIAGLVGALTTALLVIPESGAAAEAGTAQAAANGGATSPVWPPSLAASVRKRLLRLALWSGIGALLCGTGQLAAQATAANTSSAGSLNSSWLVLTTTAYGSRWALSAALLVVLVLLTRYLRATPRAHGTQPAGRDPLPTAPRRRPSGALLGLLAALVLGLVILQVLQSHAAAAVDSSFLDIATATLHLVGACLWAGGVLALAVGCVPLLGRGPAAVALAWATLRRFGLIALVSVVVLAVTGLYAAGRQVATPDALLLSFYGQTLLLKVGLMLAVGLVGLLHAASLHPRVASALGALLGRPPGWRPLSPRYLRRTLMLEACGAAMIMLLAAALAASQPARGPAFDPPVASTAGAQDLSAPADDLIVVMSVKPDRPGQNFITLGVYNTRRPAPAPITSVDVQLFPPNGGSAIVQPAPAIGNSQYQVAGGMITMPGDWRITVIAHRAGMRDAAGTLPWTVLPPAQPGADRPPLISRQPLAPLVDGGALALLLLAAVATVAAVAWRRSSRAGRARPHAAPFAAGHAPQVLQHKE